jgi:hypothetical protein
VVSIVYREDRTFSSPIFDTYPLIDFVPASCPSAFRIVENFPLERTSPPKKKNKYIPI